MPVWFRPGRLWRWIFFFFIGGVQPKKVQVDDLARPCPECGLPSARLKRVDHYLSFFFIPLVPLRRGKPFLECSRCGRVFDEQGRFQHPPSLGEPPSRCPQCGRPAEPDFRYCPGCGQNLS